jgi:putative ABC transport system substrate-binding protein
MKRRTLILGSAALLASAHSAAAQQVGKVWRIGCLWAPALVPVDQEAFRQGLRELGYVEGQGLSIEWRSAEGRDERLPSLASEMVRLKVDVIVTVGVTAPAAAQKATSEIPIVFTFVADPVAQGLVRTLAQPGANITGLSTFYAELSAKRLELLREAIPSLKAIVIITTPALPANAAAAQETQMAAHKLGLEGRIVAVRDLAEVESGIKAAAKARAGAVVLIPDPFIYTYRAQIAELATKGGLPVLGWQKRVAESGALISYGINPADVLHRAAYFVDKILKGAKPADLPVEQPTKFELVINMKTAKALGLTIPPSLLARADQVIE